MAWRGRVKNGVVVLDEKVDLPEGTKVRVRVIEHEAEIAEAEGKAKGMSSDVGAKHDQGPPALPKGELCHGTPDAEEQ